MAFHPMAQLIERWTPGLKPRFELFRRSIQHSRWGWPCGLWQGPPEGQVKPVGGVGRVQSFGHVKLWV